MQATARHFLSAEDYLAGELRSEVRHEYVGGEVYAMSGTSDVHNTIALNLAVAFRQHLGAGPCKVFMSDVKLRLEVARNDIFYYPDVLVTCDPSDREPYFKTKPVFLTEISSPSTERIDRHEKFSSYITMPSLQEYLIVSQHEPTATLFRRSTHWKPEALGPDHLLTVPALSNFSTPVAALFAGVTFAPRA